MINDFKLPGSSLEELHKIIMGYASSDKPSTLRDISVASGVPETTVSRNSGFLVAIGVIESGRKKNPTEVGMRLGKALIHGIEDEVKQIYSQMVSENEFFRNIVGAVRIRKGMDEGSLKAHIAYSAGAPRNAHTTAGSGTLVEILKLSGNLRDEDGKLITVSPSSTAGGEPSVDLDEHKVIDIKATKAAAAFRDPLRLNAGASKSPFKISINVEVKCSAEDLDLLGQRLRKLVDDFEKGAEAADNNVEGTSD